MEKRLPDLNFGKEELYYKKIYVVIIVQQACVGGFVEKAKLINRCKKSNYGRIKEELPNYLVEFRFLIF